MYTIGGSVGSVIGDDNADFPIVESPPVSIIVSGMYVIGTTRSTNKRSNIRANKPCRKGKLVLGRRIIIVYSLCQRRNCYYYTERVCLRSLQTPVNAWSKLCVTFERGTYKFYHNGQQYQEHTLQGLPTPVPYNSHRAATLGYKPTYPTFQGYMDDVRQTLISLYSTFSLSLSLSLSLILCVTLCIRSQLSSMV